MPLLGSSLILVPLALPVTHLLYVFKSSLPFSGASMGGPTLIGETGIAMDIVRKEAFRTGDWSSHVNSLDNVMSAMDNNLLSFTLWNYSPQNDNLHGDQWNDEDLSLYSRSQVKPSDHKHDPYSGGRALAAAVSVRPLRY